MPETCPPGPDQAPAELSLLAPTGFEAIELAGGPLASPAAVDPAEAPIVATVLGGTGLPAELLLLDGPGEGLSITSMTADFLPFGTATTLAVTVNIDGPAAAVVLPDRDVSGQLRVAVAWTSACGEGAGSGSLALQVVDSSVAEGCPTTSDGLPDALLPLATAKVTIGSLDVPLVVTGWSGRWIEGSGASDAPEFAAWDQKRSTTVAPGASVVVRESIDDLHLQSVFAQVFRRADVLAYLDADSTGELVTLTATRRSANARGRVSIPMPLEPGSYVLEIQAAWLTSCLQLESQPVVTVEVR